MNHCESKKLKISLMYVSVKTTLKETLHNFCDDYKYVKLTFKDNQTPDQLNKIYNICRINLTLSGRDACPRTISESLAAGCYNIALDSLSDGKDYFKNNLLGTLIRGDKIYLLSAGSLCYKSTPKMWDKILNASDRSFDHKQISVQSLQDYNINKTVQDITNQPEETTL